jgi:hypothetical protein
MGRIVKTLAWGVVCFVPFLYVSCLSMSLPKSAKVQSSAGSTQVPTRLEPKASVDKGLLDTWELLYQVNDKGDQERPRESTRTLIEFTDRGQVIFNSMDKERSDRVKSRSGKYSVQENRINITDDVGNTVSWPYQLAGDTLILMMPEKNRKFYWRRFR